MSTGNFLTLEKPMAPFLVRVLYGVALALILLGLIAGVIGGIRMMTHVPMSRPGDMARMDLGGAAPLQAAPGVAPSDVQMPGRGRHHFGMRGHRRGALFGMLRGQPPAVIGGARILLALLRAALLLLVARILAELSLAVLARRAEA